MRLGSYYRRLVLRRLGVRPVGPLALDVGAHDGSVLEAAPDVRIVGLDLAPGRAAANGPDMVRGDGKRPPFPSERFASVFALDVLEHEAQDGALMAALLGLAAPGGSLWVSVPHREYRAAPAFLTAELHRRWGHVRPGYAPEELCALLPDGWRAEMTLWNEPAFRAVYLPARALWRRAPETARLLLRWAAALDARRPDGGHGHVFAQIVRRPTPAGARERWQ